MKLHSDLVRKMLIKIEDDFGYQEDFKLKDMYKLARENGYDPNDGVYTAKKLGEAGLVKGHFTDVIAIEELTYEGHMFLKNIKDESIWLKTKALTSDISSVSIDILKDVATTLVKRHLNLN